MRERSRALGPSAARVAASFSLLCALLVCRSQASAQAATLIQQAEDAYINVEFEQTIALCQQAIEGGELSLSQLIRVYELLGISNAASEDERAARDAYVRLLALDPERDVSQDLPPRLRSPFLEARGFWSSRSDRLGAEVQIERARGVAVVDISDPLSMVSQVRVYSRAADTGDPMRAQATPAGPSVEVGIPALPDAPRVEYYVQLLDENGNVVHTVGSAREPRSFGESVLTAATLSEEEGGVSPWVWIVTAASAVVVGLAVGAYFLFRDEPVNVTGGISF